MAQEKSGRLLVVDDEIETLTPLCDLLSEWGYEVTRCTSGKEALEAFKKQQFDVLLADLVMPEMDGIELIKASMEIDPLLVCIIITGHGTIQTAVDAMKNMAFDYVLKPIEWKMLKPIISRAMETRRLRESEKQYRSIVEDQTELICRWKPGEILTFVTDVYCRYFNKSPEELLGRSFLTLIHEEDHENVRQHFASLTQENPVSTHEHRVISPDGEICWQQWTNRVIFDSQGNIIEYQSVGCDITERKKLEDDLKKIYNFQSSLIKNVGEGICVCHNTDKYPFVQFTVWNDRMTDITGYTMEEINRSGWYQTVYPDPELQTRAIERMDRMRKGDNLFGEEWEITRSDGENRIVNITTSIIESSEGSIHVLALMADITERKQADEALKESEESYRGLSDSISDIFFAMDKDLKYTYWNKASENLTGISKKNAIGKSLYEIFPDNLEIRRAEKVYREALKTHEKQNIISEYQGYIYEIDVYPSKKGISVFVKDITERKKMEEELKEERFKLREYFENLPVPAYNVTFDGKIVDCNNVAVSTLEYDNKDELIGKPVITTIYAPSSQEKSKQLFEKWKKWGKLKNEELQIITKQGELKDVLLNVATIYDHKGNPLYSISTQLDITERKRAENELKRSRDFLEKLTDSMWDAVFSVKLPERTIEWANDSFGLTGYDAQECIGKTTEFLYPDKKEYLDFGNKLGNAIDAGKDLLHAEQFLRRKNGQVFPVEITATIFRESGEVYRVTSIVSDITERKRAEKEILLANERLNYLLSSTNAVIYTAKTFGDYGATFISKNVKQMTGYKPQNFIEDSSFWYQHIHPEDQPLIEEEVSKIFRKRLYSYEYRFQRQDGTYIWVRNEMKLVQDEKGNPLEIIGFMVDITEHKKAEEKLQESEERYRDLYDNAPDMYHTLDENGVIVECNKTEAKMLGYKKEEIIGRPVTDFFTEESKRLFETDFPSLKEKKGLFNLERDFIRKDGTTFPSSLNVFSEYDENGNFAGTKTIARDITERKRLEDILKKEQQELRLIIDSSPIIVFYKDKEGKFIRVNKAFAEALKMPEEEFKGKTVFDLYSAKIAQGMTNDDREVFKTGRPKINIIEQYESASGIRWVQTEKIPICDNNGIPVGLIGFAQDITERKEAEEKLRKSEIKHRTLVENLPQKIFMKDKNSVYISCNEIYARDLKIEPENIFGKTDYDFYPKELAEKYIADDKRIMYSGKIEEIEEKYIQEGEERFVHTTKTSVKDEQRNVIGILGIFWDITNRRRAEEALQESEEKYRLHFENVNDVIYSVDTEFKILSISPSVKKILGYEPEELIGKKFQDLNIVSPEYLEAAFTDTMRVLSGETITASVYKFIAKAGTTRFGEVSGSPLIRDGKVVAVISVARDITDRKLAEDALRESEQKNRLLLEHAGIGIGYYTLEGKIISFNKLAIDYMGGKPEDFSGKTVFEIFDKEMAEVILERIQTASKSVTSIEYEDLISLPSGKKWFLSTYTNIIGPDGNSIGVQIISHDITERKRAEEAIRESENRLKSIFRTAPVGIGVLSSPDRIIMDVNDEICKMLGYYESELIGKNARIVYPTYKEFKRVGKEKYKQIKDYGVGTVETQFKRKDGRIIDIILSSSPIDRTDPSKGITFTAMDITDRKKAEVEIRKSEERLRTLADAAFEGIVFHKGGILLRANNQFFRMFRYKPDELIGKDILQLLVAPEARAFMKKQIAFGKQGPYESICVRKDGKKFPVEIRARETELEGQKIRVATIMDITKRKKAEEALKESEEKYRTLVNNVNIGVYRTTGEPHGRFLQANPAIAKIFGHDSTEELMKLPIYKLYQDSKERKTFVEKIQKHGFVKEEELKLKKKDGTSIWAAVTANATYDKNGEIAWIDGVIEDVTERKIAEHELRRSHDQLRALTTRLSEVEDAERKQLAQELHDQVGQNLTALGINLNTLPTLVSPKEADKIKDRITDTQNILNETTQSIRNVMADLRPSVLDDYGLVAAVRWYSHNFSQRAGIPVKITGKPLFPRLPGFLETTLYRIAKESLTNVAKHSRAKIATIRFRETKGKVNLTIFDDGKGFTPETVFKKKKQTVWGLLTMKERAEAIGGKLEIESSPGKGTKIIVEIKR